MYSPVTLNRVVWSKGDIRDLGLRIGFNARDGSLPDRSPSVPARFATNAVPERSDRTVAEVDRAEVTETTDDVRR